jgi:hypothetical protein
VYYYTIYGTGGGEYERYKSVCSGFVFRGHPLAMLANLGRICPMDLTGIRE